MAVLFVWYEWRQYQQRISLRRQLDQRLTVLYATESIVPTTETHQNVPAEGTPDIVTSSPDADTVAADATASKQFLDKLDLIILKNLLHEDLDMAFLASEMCMSHSTLYRRIKSITGMTVNEYVRKHRLAKSMQLLHQGFSVSETSYQCGFSSPNYFRRCFKSEYGMLPSEVG